MLPLLTILFGYQLFSIANELKNEVLMKTNIKKEGENKIHYCSVMIIILNATMSNK